MTLPPLERFRRAARRGIFLDYDGTLSEIAARPELAVPVPRAVDVLARLVASSEIVALVSGRPGEDIRRLVPVPGIRVLGHYGIPEGTPTLRTRPAVAAAVDRAAAQVEGAWVEDKGASLAVHVRGARDPARAGGRLATMLEDIARVHGLALVIGKMVYELTPTATPGKGAVVFSLARARAVDGCLYAGDDRPDMAAFEALDALAGQGVATVKVAVRTEETPEDLVGAADVVVERPAGLVTLLDSL